MGYSREQINSELLFEMPQLATDVAVVFGVRSFSAQVARVAANLYRADRFKKIIVTGGMPVRQIFTTAAFGIGAGLKGRLGFALSREFFSSSLEADQICSVLHTRGVPENAVIKIDRDSRNTGENVANVCKVVKAFESATIITLAPFQRRTLGTMRTRVPPHYVALTSVPVYPTGMGRDNWHEHPFVDRVMQNEMRKIDPANDNNYAFRGFYIPFDIEQESALVLEKTQALGLAASPQTRAIG